MVEIDTKICLKKINKNNKNMEKDIVTLEKQHFRKVMLIVCKKCINKFRYLWIF